MLSLETSASCGEITLLVVVIITYDEEPCVDDAVTSIEPASATRDLAAPRSESAQIGIGAALKTCSLRTSCGESALAAFVLAGPRFETALTPFAFTQRRTQNVLPHAGTAVTSLDDTRTRIAPSEPSEALADLRRVRALDRQDPTRESGFVEIFRLPPRDEW